VGDCPWKKYHLEMVEEVADIVDRCLILLKVGLSKNLYFVTSVGRDNIIKVRKS
jgi:hypothetical protein